MALGPAFIHIAERLQEVATKMCHADIQTRISDALRDATKASGNYCYVANVFGDDKSGSVVYSCGYDGGLKKASYTITGADCTIDTASAVDVQPLTTYEVETADLTEAGARNSKRDMAQLQSIHDASAKLGAACKVTESAPIVPRETTHTLVLKESVPFVLDIPLQEAFKPSYQIKLIAPGKGASAFYPAEVLKRDGPKVFKAGTPMRIDHPTKAEEAARPEGSVKDWGAVLENDAYWLDSHAQGPGLYGKVKPFSDHVATIDEKGPYAGVSIRANGSAVMEAGRPVLRDGLPLLASLASAEGVDMVTRAGAGGMFLRESAPPNPNPEPQPIPQGVQMDEAAVKSLVDAAVLAATTPLKERALKGDAQILAARTLATVSLSESQKQYVIENVLSTGVPLVEGKVDETKLSEAVIAEAKRYGATVSNGARVTGMGVVGMPLVEAKPVEQPKPEDINAASVKTFMRLGLSEAAAKAAVKGRVA